MAKIILSINAGSSSVKISVFKAEENAQPPKRLAEAQIAGLTAPPTTFSYEGGQENIRGKEVDGIGSHDDAFQYFLNYLVRESRLEEIARRDDISHACHRVVHGGNYKKPVVISAEAFRHLEALTDLAPL
jgi:acetate kinase